MQWTRIEYWIWSTPETWSCSLKVGGVEMKKTSYRPVPRNGWLTFPMMLICDSSPRCTCNHLHSYFSIGPIANRRALIFSRVYLWVCLCVCLWPALLPFNVDRLWWNSVTRTLLWPSLAVTIMVQIGRRGTVRRLFENFKKFWKITEFEFQNSGPSFFASVSPVYCKKFNSIRTKLTKEIHFEVCPYGDSGNGTATAARRSPGYSNWTGSAAACCDRSSGAFRTGGVRNWGRNRAVQIHRLVSVSLCLSVCVADKSDAGMMRERIAFALPGFLLVVLQEVVGYHVARECATFVGFFDVVSVRATDQPQR